MLSREVAFPEMSVRSGWSQVTNVRHVGRDAEDEIGHFAKHVKSPKTSRNVGFECDVQLVWNGVETAMRLKWC